MKKLKILIEQLHLNYKHELIKIGLYFVVVLGVCIFIFFLKGLLIAFVSLFVLALMVVLYVTNYYQLQHTLNEEAKIMSFIEAFIILKIFIYNKFNVYNAIEQTIKYVRDNVKDLFITLLEDIDIDKSITPFINFARQFPINIIEQLMIGLYQIDVEGLAIVPLEGFDYMFDQFQNLKQQETTRIYEQRLEGLNMFPLLGAAIIAISLLIGVIQIVLEALNGL